MASGQNKKDWTGQKHYRLTFISSTDRRYRGSVIWEALCDCGKTVYLRPPHVVSGATKSCGCLHDESSAAKGRDSRKYDPIISSARSVWLRTYAEGDIDFDTFYALSQQTCDYCGAVPAKTWNLAQQPSRSCSEEQVKNGFFIYNGLDRIDSSKPHTKDNVVTCCWECNNAKGKRTCEEFFSHIERMYEGTRKYRLPR